MSNDWTESELAAAWATPKPRPRPTPPCERGNRVRLTAPMRNHDWETIKVEDVPVGTEGTVKYINTACGPDIGYQIYVHWDNGRSLDLLPGDSFEVIE